MKKILITGGRGYIARNLVPLLQLVGYEVVAPTREQMDLLDEPMVSEYLEREQPQIIIHAATRGTGRPNKDDWEKVYVENMIMWETLQTVACSEGTRIQKLILFGSGAEFDTRGPIRELDGNQIQYIYPMDPYGLSKNLITRSALQNYNHTYVLRLFGCFNFDENPSRFIKAGILNLIRGLPITVNENREFDFFYLDDIIPVIDRIIQEERCPRDINLVYREKHTLLDVARIIHKHMKSETGINLVEMYKGLPYTGSSFNLDRMNLNLVGLDEGIRRTVQKLT